MKTHFLFGSSAAGLTLLLGAAGASAGATLITIDQPSLDRWMYPFNASPGIRTASPTFGAVGVEFFDDREAQFLIGFDTAADDPPLVEPGLVLSRYRVHSAIVTGTIAIGGVFTYDPTSDAFQTYLDPTDPDALPDPDAGRPIELFGAGYRNNASLATFEETSPFSTSPQPGPAPNIRDVFASDFLNGVARDVSTNVRDGFDPVPFAVGQMQDAAVGASVPTDAIFTFTLDLTNSDVKRYLREGLQAGRLNFLITSLHEASGGPDGGAGVTYPVFFNKEDKFADLFMLAATLTLEVEALPPSPQDLTGDGIVNAADLSVLLAQWGTAGPEADFDGNGDVGAPDLSALLSNWTIDDH